MALRRTLLVASLLATTACGLSVVGSLGAPGTEVDGSVPSSGDAAVPPGGDDGGSDAPSEAGDSGDAAPTYVPWTQRDDAGCPIGRGPAMLRLFGTSASSPALCIDESEVSSRQYKAFVTDFATQLVPPQSPECVANSDVVPTDPTTGAMPSLDADDPVDRIDNCDAHLFCAWAGKHLCGRRDGTDTFIPSGSATDATISEWDSACSNNGTAQSVPATCNLIANNEPGRGADDQVLVTQAPTGGPTYGGHVLHHIVGNVEEWADGCDGAGTCIARGASYYTTGTTDCTTRITHPRMDRKKDLGFRCCAKPVP